MSKRDWSSDVCSSDLCVVKDEIARPLGKAGRQLKGVIEGKAHRCVSDRGRTLEVDRIAERDQARSEERRVGKGCGDQWGREGWREQQEERARGRTVTQ